MVSQLSQTFGRHVTPVRPIQKFLLLMEQNLACSLEVYLRRDLIHQQVNVVLHHLISAPCVNCFSYSDNGTDQKNKNCCQAQDDLLFLWQRIIIFCPMIKERERERCTTRIEVDRRTNILNNVPSECVTVFSKFIDHDYQVPMYIGHLLLCVVLLLPAQTPIQKKIGDSLQEANVSVLRLDSDPRYHRFSGLTPDMTSCTGVILQGNYVSCQSGRCCATKGHSK